ncbi:MAG: hypothetical protein HWE16_05790 [Gammaproteobacteria bacterium]|nr:hypothetical protein [Gammaproteobacteria bacterium]
MQNYNYCKHQVDFFIGCQPTEYAQSILAPCYKVFFEEFYNSGSTYTSNKKAKSEFSIYSLVSKIFDEVIEEQIFSYLKSYPAFSELFGMKGFSLFLKGFSGNYDSWIKSNQDLLYALWDLSISSHQEESVFDKRDVFFFLQVFGSFVLSQNNIRNKNRSSITSSYLNHNMLYSFDTFYLDKKHFSYFGNISKQITHDRDLNLSRYCRFCGEFTERYTHLKDKFFNNENIDFVKFKKYLFNNYTFQKDYYSSDNQGKGYLTAVDAITFQGKEGLELLFEYILELHYYVKVNDIYSDDLAQFSANYCSYHKSSNNSYRYRKNKDFFNSDDFGGLNHFDLLLSENSINLLNMLSREGLLEVRYVEQGLKSLRHLAKAHLVCSGTAKFAPFKGIKTLTQLVDVSKQQSKAINF